jgi:septal ring factor EnvC (AmiA/AmiB activator)
MKCENKLLKLFYFSRSSSGWLLVLLVVLLIAGRTPLLSQDSGPKSNSSSEILPIFDLSLETLNRLRNQASDQLTGLTQDLNQASQELQTSKAQLTRLQNLLDNALQKSNELKATNQRITEANQQIGERMQERDEDLARVYGTIDSQDKQILKMWIAIVALGLGCLGLIAFGIVKLLIKFHLP